MALPISAARVNSKPLIVVLGATGSGKSKLAIELAQKFNGEIISADSMQIYSGLDIITNKVTLEEQQLATHHCISYVNPLIRYTVTDFRNYTLPLIGRIKSDGKLPIIVGGTNYYIESLMWKVLVSPKETVSNRLLYELDESYSHQSQQKNVLNQQLDSENLAQAKSESFENGKKCETHTESTNELNCDCAGTVKMCFSPDMNFKAGDNEHHSLGNIFERKITSESLKEIPSITLHKLLSQVDPVMAKKLHPHNYRKIVRSLQIYQQHNRCHSEILAEQHAMKGGNSLGGPLRYPDSYILWLQCDQSVLNERIEKRVDQMIENGLLKELLDFHADYNKHRIKHNLEADYTKGIFQSIGFKEFHKYLMLSEEEKVSENGLKMLQEGIENVKTATKQYSKKQIKWIVNRFLRKPDRQVPLIYALNATNVALWEKDVFAVASHIVESLIQRKQPSITALPVEEGFTNIEESYYCDVCERIIVGSLSWEAHLKSRKHYKRKKKKTETEETSIRN